MLTQVISILPLRTKTISPLWCFILVPILPYLSNLIYQHRAAQSSTWPGQSNNHHPIESLIREARADLEHRLKHQSQNYTAAYHEYHRRYNMDPPPGFEAWYQFAVASQSVIIDDFDTIYERISPFWKLTGKEVLEITRQLQNDPSLDLWRCTFSSTTAETHCHHPWRTFDRHISLLFNKRPGDLRGAIPDVNFLVNHLDEPRVLIPPSTVQKKSGQGQWYKATDLSRQPSWAALTKYCAAHADLQPPPIEPELFGLPFVRNRSSAMDLCQHPEYNHMHGLFQSPTSLHILEGPVPILSTGSLSTMGDLLFPSPAYLESEFQYDEKHDPAWSHKQNTLYWAGSTTGAVAHDDNWPNFHRQRFVALAQNLGKQQHHSYLQQNNGIISRATSSFLNRRLFDVAFTRIFQCEYRRCRAQRRFFRPKPWADGNEAFQSRLVFDMDGNGISGRYYKLLASKSAPLKQTLLREWHDDRLVPWVHFIPVSQGIEELPEIVSYLTLSESGRQRAREIAEQGREWSARALRDVDASVYLYRLMLELGRLQNSDRAALI